MIASFQNVAKWYGDVIGLVDVSVELGAGVTALLGPNGAGKSTLLKLLTGQLQPSTGTVRVLGDDPFKKTRVHRRIGFCPEPDAFYESMSGRAFVTYLTRLHGFSHAEARRRADAAIETVGMEANAGRRIRTYSKGMRQRIKLAQAITHDPEILVLDEPLNGLDPLARRFIIELIRKLGESGTTVLVSSHILHEVEAMTRQVLLLYQGRVLADGTIEEIRAYLDRYPHRIVVRSPGARELARTLLELPGVSGVQIEDGAVCVNTGNPDEVFDRLPSLVLEENFEIEAVEATDVSLEAIFEYLVG
ncbi:MAG: ABC transporter ATP-binding protein [Planctomycetota bacterium]|nr:ABC transporter ATP-binding protein [Planctomycetota bacterium]